MTTEEAKLIEEIKGISKIETTKNERFHDYAHAISVFNNAKEIIEGEGAENNVNVLAILTAALFHDLSNYEGLEEGIDGANKARQILNKVKGFPEGSIRDVERLIMSVETGPSNNAFDEKIINDADSSDALSKLSICRGFMLYGKRGLKLYDAIKDFRSFIDKKRKQLFTKTALKIADKQMPFIKKFLEDCLELY